MTQPIVTALAFATLVLLTACGRDEKPTQVIIQQPQPQPQSTTTVITPSPQEPVVVVPR